MGFVEIVLNENVFKENLLNRCVANLINFAYGDISVRKKVFAKFNSFWLRLSNKIKSTALMLLLLIESNAK